MYNFFIKQNAVINNGYQISGNDYNHIKNVLRMKIGDTLLVSIDGKSHLCQIKEFTEQTVVLSTVQENYLDTSLPIDICLLQGLPKSDKLELIIQKTVELGVSKIIPVETARSIVKIDIKKARAKTERYNAIAESAAKQSKRTLIPTVQEPITFKKMLESVDNFDLLIVPFESKNGMEDTKNTLNKIKKGMKIGVLIGAEGGFEQSEIDALISKGANVISLGKRILRTETAAILSVGMLMLHAENYLSD
ncbi:MAG: 16S rRNA (uracil(1498)-N(3))-methyltransferase [Clostridia bacterium]|nr:16S rRNA (uracil(1498)-N(3))-methyltransferase [Clostridia bacterium]